MWTDLHVRLFLQPDCAEHPVQTCFDLPGRRRYLSGDIMTDEELSRINIAVPDKIWADQKQEAAPDF